MKIFLTDNGSLRPQAVFSLRELAKSVGHSLQLEVTPASLLHTERIPASDLQGQAAPILETQLRDQLAAGERNFCILPLFFGPSRAITEYLPAVQSRLTSRYGSFQLKVAPCLVSPDQPSTIEAVGKLLLDGIRQTLDSHDKSTSGILLVDHGTPEIRVHHVRESLGSYLSKQTEIQGIPFQTASMERREGDEYAFNEPLLENALRAPKFENRHIILSMLFLQPGRHAGPKGDVETICRQSLENYSDRSFAITPLVGEHPGLVEILVQRYQSTQA